LHCSASRGKNQHKGSHYYSVSARPIGVDLSPIQSVGLRVSVSVRKVYGGKTAEWIRMPFGVVSEVGQGMGVLDGW